MSKSQKPENTPEQPRSTFHREPDAVPTSLHPDDHTTTSDGKSRDGRSPAGPDAPQGRQDAPREGQPSHPYATTPTKTDAGLRHDERYPDARTGEYPSHDEKRTDERYQDSRTGDARSHDYRTPLTQNLVQTPPTVVPSDYDEQGQYIAHDGSRNFTVVIAGKRYEHVSETHDGKWVYRKS